MNGARSIFMRKGYWLTALAAAVLLAASSGTALAQGVGFVGSSSRTMEEGASPAMTTAAPIEVEFNISGLVLAGDDADPEALGELKIQHNADVAPPGPGDARTAANRRIWIDSNSPALDATMFAWKTRLRPHMTTCMDWITTTRFLTTRTASSSWSSSIRAVMATGSTPVSP